MVAEGEPERSRKPRRAEAPGPRIKAWDAIRGRLLLWEKAAEAWVEGREVLS